VSYECKCGSVVVKPELHAAWQHEFGDAVYDISSNFANGAGDSFVVGGPQIGRDSVLLGAGFAVMFNGRTSAFVYYDGELGRRNYQSAAVTGGFRFAF
jgi:outer membrane autotransporter protein